MTRPRLDCGRCAWQRREPGRSRRLSDQLPAYWQRCPAGFDTTPQHSVWRTGAQDLGLDLRASILEAAESANAVDDARMRGSGGSEVPPRSRRAPAATHRNRDEISGTCDFLGQGAYFGSWLTRCLGGGRIRPYAR
jgi:hypothetical protein